MSGSYRPEIAEIAGIAEIAHRSIIEVPLGLGWTCN